MRLRHAAFTASLLALACASPALAGSQPGSWVAPDGRVYQGMGTAPEYHMPDYDERDYDDNHFDNRDYDRQYAVYLKEREAWFEDCVRRGGPSGVTGALIGGAVGGVAGNRIAGRGNRTLGTIVGAGVGAVAGAVIERSSERDRIRDQCEAQLERAQADYDAHHDAYEYAAGPPPLPAPSMAHHDMDEPRQAMPISHPTPHAMPMPRRGVPMAGHPMTKHPKGQPMPMSGYPMGYGYAVPMMMVPVMMMPSAKPECEEVVTEIIEWVDAPTRRAAPRRVIRDKRVKIAPDKRLRMK